LNYKEIHIPAPLELNKTTLKELDHTYHMLDGQLSKQLRKVRDNIKRIHDARVTTAAEVCAYIALSLATINSIVFPFYFAAAVVDGTVTPPPLLCHHSRSLSLCHHLLPRLWRPSLLNKSSLHARYATRHYIHELLILAFRCSTAIFGEFDL